MCSNIRGFIFDHFLVGFHTAFIGDHKYSQAPRRLTELYSWPIILFTVGFLKRTAVMAWGVGVGGTKAVSSEPKTPCRKIQKGHLPTIGAQK